MKERKLLVINYYRADLAAPAKEGVLRFVDSAALPPGILLSQAHANAIGWASNNVHRQAATVYQIAYLNGPAISLAHYLPDRLPK